MHIFDNIGGAERRITRIFNEIAAEKNIDFITMGKQTSIDKFFNENINTVNFNKTVVFKKSNVGMLKILFFLFSSKYNSIVYFDATRFTVLINFFALLLRKKVLIIIANPFAAYNMLKGKLNRYFNYCLKTSAHIDCLYPSAEQDLKTRFPKKNITTTPNSFTDLKRFTPKKKEKLFVFAAARLEKSKNPHLLIDAINIIQEKVRKEDYKIVICGGGFDKEQLIQKVKEDRTDDIISFVGNVKTIDFFPQAELFFSLQVIENYPSQSLLEAISCGCYIIATDVGSTRAIADGIEFSTLVNNDKNELSNAILKYFEFSQEEKEACSKKARTFSENNFIIEPNIKYFSNIINNFNS